MSDTALFRLFPPIAILTGAGMVIFGGQLALAAVAGLAVIAAVAVRPALGAYIYLAVTPLAAGIRRDLFFPVLRVHEALLALIVVGLLIRGLIWMLRGHQYRPRLARIDVAVFALAVTGSLVSLLWRFAQGEAISADDILYASVFWKYLVLYAVFRVAIKSRAEAAVALWVALSTTAVVALVGVLQALGLFGVPELLFTWYPAFLGETATVGRGASTLGLTFAVADVCLICAAAAFSLLRESTGRKRTLLIGLITMFILGAVAAGQFSGFIGIAVAVVALGVAMGELRKVIRYGAMASLAGGLLTLPVILDRFSGFQTADGVPQSWSGRLDNLTTFVIPRFANGWNVVFGVQPAARVPAPETWRDWVFIESGYLWLLWSGGIPLLISFVYFIRTALGLLKGAIRRHDGEIRAIATGAFVGIWVIVALTVFDPHLTMRGVADLLFPLIAMAQIGVVAGASAPIRREMVPV